MAPRRGRRSAAAACGGALAGALAAAAQAAAHERAGGPAWLAGEVRRLRRDLAALAARLDAAAVPALAPRAPPPAVAPGPSPPAPPSGAQAAAGPLEVDGCADLAPDPAPLASPAVRRAMAPSAAAAAAAAGPQAPPSSPPTPSTSRPSACATSPVAAPCAGARPPAGGCAAPAARADDVVKEVPDATAACRAAVAPVAAQPCTQLRGEGAGTQIGTEEEAARPVACPADGPLLPAPPAPGGAMAASLPRPLADAPAALVAAGRELAAARQLQRDLARAFTAAAPAAAGPAMDLLIQQATVVDALEARLRALGQEPAARS